MKSKHESENYYKLDSYRKYILSVKKKFGCARCIFAYLDIIKLYLNHKQLYFNEDKNEK